MFKAMLDRYRVVGCHIRYGNTCGHACGAGGEVRKVLSVYLRLGNNSERIFEPGDYEFDLAYQAAEKFESAKRAQESKSPEVVPTQAQVANQKRWQEFSQGGEGE